jgi:hypothetical protein
MAARYRGREMAVVGQYYQQVLGAGGQPVLMPVAMHAMAPQGGQQMQMTAAQQVAPIFAAPAPQPPPADWMNRRAAPGIYDPDEDLVPLPLLPDTNGGVFVAGGPTTITWVGRVQKPFQGERLLASVSPTGASVAGVVALGQIYVGTDPQMAQIGSFNLAFYVPGAFGVRHKWTPAEPGIDINIPVTLSVYPTGTDSVFISMQVNGAILQ